MSSTMRDRATAASFMLSTSPVVASFLGLRATPAVHDIAPAFRLSPYAFPQSIEPSHSSHSIYSSHSQLSNIPVPSHLPQFLPYVSPYFPSFISLLIIPSTSSTQPPSNFRSSKKKRLCTTSPSSRPMISMNTPFNCEVERKWWDGTFWI
jgi:hypothetical protein